MAEWDLEANGFCLRRWQSSVSNFRDDGQVRTRYYKEMAEFVKKETGCQWVGVLPVRGGHILRTETPEDFNDAYSRYAHTDYNENMATFGQQGTLRTILSEANKTAGLTAEKALALTYKWVNTWQPVENSVQQDPLVMLDPRTLEPSDLIEYRYDANKPKYL